LATSGGRLDALQLRVLTQAWVLRDLDIPALAKTTGLTADEVTECTRSARSWSID
jgi:hypothetical protein